MNKTYSLSQQFNICQACHPLLRLTESCALKPDLLAIPKMISNDELYTSEQLTELREAKITFTTFRENLLLNENMQPFVMNLILYASSFFEMIMVAASFLAACLPVLLVMAYVFTRKPDFCRALVVYISAKIVFVWWSDENWALISENEKFYVCTLQGDLRESTTLSEQCFVLSAFLAYVVLSTVLSMNNGICGNMMQRLNVAFYAMIAGGVYMFTLFLSKYHLMQNSQTMTTISMQMGMGFGVVFFAIMIITNLWPIRLMSCIVEPSSQEDILLNHLCSKWDINTDQPKIEKMTAIIDKLQTVL